MMLHNNIRLAWSSIKRAKLRNLMTMFGIIIGVVSVITTVNIGQGVKNQVSSQIDEFGSDLLIVRPGADLQNKVGLGGISVSGPLNNNSVLSTQDVDAVVNTDGVRFAAPLSVINGVPAYHGQELPTAVVMGTTSSLPQLLNKKIEYGEFLSDSDEGKYFAVIGRSVAEQLFGENAPIGKQMNFRGKVLVVKGVFKESDSTPLTLGTDFNNAIVIPYTTSQILSDGNARVFQILAKPHQPAGVDRAQKNIDKTLQDLHNGQRDFTVLKQSETLKIANNILSLLTTFVAGVAGISLMVGGVGVMNVMLVSVTERTHEIGIRKAVGATNRQIMMQFLIEAIMLSFVGSVVGVLLSILISFLLRILTDLKPAMSWSMMGIAVLVSLAAGIIFGVAPAFKAARKDPIQALRNQQ